MKRLNENVSLRFPRYRNDIFRKFRAQFGFLLSNPPREGTIYLDNKAEGKYRDKLNEFSSSISNDILYLVGFTGVGKSALLRHFYNYYNNPVIFQNSIVIPLSWDSITSKELPEVIIRDAILNAVLLIENKNPEEYIIDELDNLWSFYIKYFASQRPVLAATEIKKNWREKALTKACKKQPLEYALAMLFYVLSKQGNHVDRIILINDDLETVELTKVQKIYEINMRLWSIIQNLRMDNYQPILDLILSMRPHTFKYLQSRAFVPELNAFNTYLQTKSKLLKKDTTPNIKELLKKRFRWAQQNVKKPGNPATWREACNTLEKIIDNISENVIAIVHKLCRYNIRFCAQWFEMILSNRVWRQEYLFDDEHPQVREKDYRFDIVNVVRTLACGEMPIYMGESVSILAWGQNDELQSFQPFDGSRIFIPNVLINYDNHTCDVLPAIIMRYVFYFCKNPSLPQECFLTKKELIDRLCSIFVNEVTERKLNRILDHLFENRVIRKSLICNKIASRMNTLANDDYIYLTSKGEALLDMLGADSMLLEIYREDVVREYKEGYFKSSYEFIQENQREELYEDLVNLCNELYRSEDNYQSSIPRDKIQAFYAEPFAITKQALNGIKQSVSKATDIEIVHINILIKNLEKIIEDRIRELNVGDVA